MAPLPLSLAINLDHANIVLLNCLKHNVRGKKGTSSWVTHNLFDDKQRYGDTAIELLTW